MTGDSSFEAGVSATIFDLYGVHARTSEYTLMGKFRELFGYETSHMLRYMVLFALLKSNAYSEDGSDGQFAWSTALMNRSDVREIFGVPLYDDTSLEVLSKMRFSDQ